MLKCPWGGRVRVRRGLGWLGLGLALLSTPACHRKAPGPEACHRFALKVHGIPEDATLLPPRVKAVVDEVTVKCLTTPFDRELIRCVDEGRGAERCLSEYQQRLQLRAHELRAGDPWEEF